MTKKEKEREEQLAKLRELLKPGGTVFTSLLSVSRSGMSRTIKPWIICNGEPLNISYAVAAITGNTHIDKGISYGVRIGGCGMDMGFALVYALSSALFRDGFKCIGTGKKHGDRCPSNDHANAGNALAHDLCPVCGGKIKKVTEFKRMGHRVCSRNCARRPWIHKDGGYALRQRWA